MTELWASYWPFLLAAVAIGLLVGLIAFRPRQRVRLSESAAPVRPHMMAATGPGEGKGVADEFAAAATDVAGQVLGAPVHGQLPGATGAPDDLQKLKGVGPKFAALLNQMGISRYDQIAGLSEGQVEEIDAAAGAFRGRFARDQIVAQADYLARGDLDGYETRFGKL